MFDDVTRDLSIAIIVLASVLSILIYAESTIKARLINEKYGTNYTATEMFFAGDTIEKVIVGEQKNISIK